MHQCCFLDNHLSTQSKFHYQEDWLSECYILNFIIVNPRNFNCSLFSSDYSILLDLECSYVIFFHSSAIFPLFFNHLLFICNLSLLLESSLIHLQSLHSSWTWMLICIFFHHSIFLWCNSCPWQTILLNHQCTVNIFNSRASRNGQWLCTFESAITFDSALYSLPDEEE